MIKIEVAISNRIISNTHKIFANLKYILIIFYSDVLALRVTEPSENILINPRHKTDTRMAREASRGKGQ